jgi:hypothetical protein
MYDEVYEWREGYLRNPFKLLGIYKQKKGKRDFELSVGNNPHWSTRAPMKYMNYENFF